MICQNMPEHGVVDVSAAVVANCGAYVVVNLADVFDQFLDGHLLEIGMSIQGTIQLGYVSVVVLGVVNLHGARIDMRLEGIVSVRQYRKFVGHDPAPFEIGCGES